jgi:hypothetical protein
MKRVLLCLGLALGWYQSLAGQPVPGDVFREYRWFYEKGDAGQAMRVGRDRKTHFPDSGKAVWPHALDLEEAVKAEIVAEKVLCHDGTTGLAIQINDSDWFYFPEAKAIPAPPGQYQHHTYPVLRVPLSIFRSGMGNSFRLRVDPKHPWNWPQNLINGLHIRIYYNPESKSHPKGTITSLKNGDTLGETVKLTVEAQGADSTISRVDYVGLYEDVNLEGDGVYRQWHYLYFHGRLLGHIGTADQAPFAVPWDTTWIPDQKEPIQIAARITDTNGVTYQTEAITGLSLDHTRRSVELCKPYGIPPKWVTRNGEKTEFFDIHGDLKRAQAAQLVWSSWSPGYKRGISINGTQVFDREGPHYQTHYHRVPLNNISVFQAGRNTLTTGKTPKINGKIVHGMEVNWPGIMVLIQYDR